LNRTFAAGNQKTWTWSGWVKRGALSANQTFFGQGTGVVLSGYGFIRFDVADTISIGASANGAISSIDWTSTPVYRDPAAWYHVVAVLDTTQATGSDRFKLYINGTIQSGTFATTPSSNADIQINRAAAHQIAVTNAGSLNGFFDGEMAEVNFVDGQALAPTSFGASSIYNQWLPVKYTGTYGTNGFYLPFSNTTSTSTLVADSSGNGNNWTPNNISLTAGSTYDSLTDVPTLTSTTAANYAVYTPLATVVTGGGTALATLTNGNLTASSAAANFYDCFSSFNIPTTGKWYFEWSVTTVGTNHYLGIASRLSWTAASRLYQNNGDKIINGTSSAYGATYTSNDVIGCAIDMDVGTLVMYKNNTTQGTLASDLVSAAPATGWCVVAEMRGTAAHSINFGQQPFTYTPPTGFVALNTYNLAAGTVTTSGTFTGNLSTDGPFVFLNGTPTTMTINGNAVTFGTQADKLANGFKVRSSSASYNASGSNTYTASVVGAVFKYEDAQGNP